MVEVGGLLYFDFVCRLEHIYAHVQVDACAQLKHELSVITFELVVPWAVI
jgi:hypothetical protein